MRSISRSGLVCVLLLPEAAEAAPVATALTRAALYDGARGRCSTALPRRRPSRLAPRPSRQEGRAARDHRPRAPLRRRATLSASSQRTPTSCAGWRWRRGRFGHPEGRVGLHVASILACIGGYPWMRE
jgi:hypothetical protein